MCVYVRVCVYVGVEGIVFMCLCMRCTSVFMWELRDGVRGACVCLYV